MQLMLHSNITYSIALLKNGVVKLMESTIGKAVALEYSGSGREIHGQAKRSFKVTKTCEILKAAIIRKFQGTVEEKSIQSTISTWLSGAPDRSGGRKEREEKKKMKLKLLERRDDLPPEQID
ncbi:uncharacterized protein [Fopius arisanus]|uniref:Uncharacterized protein isoform X2 n=1 Tax=Fopius arisanus TaxID=64838 RepID=A0A9R1UAB2_9HYME|nr:PREDICTED: uncharacterized protein LOC105272489 isoform X2 [Fopius arisanus]